MDESNQIDQCLASAKHDGSIVQIARAELDESGPHSIGYVLDYTDQFVLLHRLSDRIDLDGFEVIRKPHVTKCHASFRNADFYQRAIEMKGAPPHRLAHIDLTSMEALLHSLRHVTPLVTIHREALAPDECEIGRVEMISTDGVVVQTITSSAAWAERRAFTFEEITRIEFGGEYEKTLAMVAASQEVQPTRSGNDPRL
jgi:hypothetical protein